MTCEKFMNKFNIFSATRIAFTVIVVLGGVACTSSKPPLDYIGPNMVDGPSIKPQHADCRMDMNTKDPKCIRGLRMPPEGTIPNNFEPYPYSKDDGDLAGKALHNPLRPTKAVLLRGQKLYETYCVVCHGPKGDGAGYIVPKFPQPPPLFSEKVTKWSDGRIFHVLTRGQNLMPSYASQVTADERWAIINYVRVLQRAAHPSDADLKALQKK